jgi:wyosine [tRNA(Phe)-imidazoG37] synthetase (radical SAM superfamily)
MNACEPGSGSIEPSAVYGPVSSWRLGMSLGIDLLLVNSICSFRCIYCQLGRINVPTKVRKVFVPTAKVVNDFRHSDWQSADVMTFSGSGEPTLAANLGEVIHEIKSLSQKTIAVLTNATLLNDENVRDELSLADKVFCKLDATEARTFERINRPVEGLALQSVIDGLSKFRQQYDGWLAIQTMLMPMNAAQTIELAELVNELRPNEIQINTPTRAVPHEWQTAARGNQQSFENTSRLKVIDRRQAAEIETILRSLTQTHITSIYHE